MAWVTDRGARLIAGEAILTFLITLALLARVWSMRILKRKILGADVFVFIAWAAAVALNSCTIYSCTEGLGAYTSQLDPEQIEIHSKILFSAQFTWTTATVCCKVSILLFCMQIFDSIRSFRWISRILLFLCVSYELIFVPALVTQCKPVSALWTGKGKCNTDKYEIATVIGNQVLDTAIVVLPLPYIWNLRMPVFKKIGLSFIFSIGCAIIAILCWRLAFTLDLMAGKYDESYGLYIISLQSSLEVSLGILAACLPAISPLNSTVIFPAAKNLLTSLREKLGGSSLFNSTGGTARGQKGTGITGSSQQSGAWHKHTNLSSNSDIPFAYIEGHRHVSAVTHDASDLSPDEKRLVGRDRIHVFQEVNIDEETV